MFKDTENGSPISEATLNSYMGTTKPEESLQVSPVLFENFQGQFLISINDFYLDKLLKSKAPITFDGVLKALDENFDKGNSHNNHPHDNMNQPPYQEAEYPSIFGFTDGNRRTPYVTWEGDFQFGYEHPSFSMYTDQEGNTIFSPRALRILGYPNSQSVITTNSFFWNLSFMLTYAVSSLCLSSCALFPLASLLFFLHFLETLILYNLLIRCCSLCKIVILSIFRMLNTE